MQSYPLDIGNMTIQSIVIDSKRCVRGMMETVRLRSKWLVLNARLATFGIGDDEDSISFEEERSTEQIMGLALCCMLSS